MSQVLLIAIGAIILYATFHGVDVYGAFVDGAKDGVQMAVRIFPFMVAMMVAVAIFRTSGALDIIGKFVSPLFNIFGVPVETLPMIILKPFSGGASFGLLADALNTYGPDSYIGLLSSVMMGSSETIFYTVALYFGCVGIKNTRHTVLCAFIAQLAGIIGAVFIVNIMF